MSMINLIAAMDYNRGIGLNNKLPWPKQPADMEFFRQRTLGQFVLMGRNTYQGLPQKPLLDRTTIICSRRLQTKMSEPFNKISDTTWLTHDLDEALLRFSEYFPNKDLYIVGGQQIYQAAFDANLVERLYITQIKDVYKYDTSFPSIPLCYAVHHRHLTSPRLDIIEFHKED